MFKVNHLTAALLLLLVIVSIVLACSITIKIVKVPVNDIESDFEPVELMELPDLPQDIETPEQEPEVTPEVQEVEVVVTEYVMEDSDEETQNVIDISEDINATDSDSDSVDEENDTENEAIAEESSDLQSSLPESENRNNEPNSDTDEYYSSEIKMISYEMEVEEGIVDLTSNQIDYYDVILYKINQLKAGDPDVVDSYFGNPDIFTPELITDRVSASEVSHLESELLENGDTQVTLHICTVDYNLMNNDYTDAKYELTGGDLDSITDYIDTAAKRTVAQNLLDGKYKVCYNIPVVVHDNQIIITEAFKIAITGGWYYNNDVVLEPVECIK